MIYRSIVYCMVMCATIASAQEESDYAKQMSFLKYDSVYHELIHHHGRIFDSHFDGKHEPLSYTVISDTMGNSAKCYGSDTLKFFYKTLEIPDTAIYHIGLVDSRNFFHSIWLVTFKSDDFHIYWHVEDQMTFPIAYEEKPKVSVYRNRKDGSLVLQRIEIPNRPFIQPEIQSVKIN